MKLTFYAIPKIFSPYFLSFLIIALSMLIVSCSSSSTSIPTDYKESNSDAAKILKPDVEFTIINIDKGTSATPKKCIIDVQLPRQIQYEKIGQIAEYIKNNEGSQCTPLFIYYFLANDQPGIDSAWAYSSFNPNLEVKINGMTIEEKATLETGLQKSNKQPEDKNIVGSWLCSYGFSYTAVLRKVNDAYELSTKYADGSGETKPLYAKLINGEERLFENADYFSGTYITVEKNGNLGYFDNQGFIYDCSQSN